MTAAEQLAAVRELDALLVIAEWLQTRRAWAEYRQRRDDLAARLGLDAGPLRPAGLDPPRPP